METHREKLAETFYDWEQAGRGWSVFPINVQLEPAFKPFIGHHHTAFANIKDDGRVPSFLDRFRKKESLSRQDASNQLPAYYEDFRDDIFELTISLSSGTDITANEMKSFLSSLSGVRFPISIEYVGTSESIKVTLSAAKSDQLIISAALEATFPDIGLIDGTDILENIWLEGGPVQLIVDCGLSDEFLRPINTHDFRYSDPLANLCAIQNQLSNSDILIYQTIFTPVLNSWAESILRSTVTHEGKPFFDGAADLSPFAQQKVSSPLYAVCMRLAVRSDSAEGVHSIARDAFRSLSVFSENNTNSLIPLDNDGIDDIDHQVDLVLRLSHRNGMILNRDELISLCHFPTNHIHSTNLDRTRTNTRKAPSASVSPSIVLGENIHRGENSEVTLSLDERIKHTYVVGASGTGKSTLLLNSIIQDIENGQGVGVLDPHGDLIDKVIPLIPEDRLEDVVFLDPSDTDFPIAFNILSARNDTEKRVLTSDMTELFRRFTTSWGDQMNAVLDNAILAILESNRGGTLVDLKRFLIEPTFRNIYLESVRDLQVVYYWKNEFPMLQGKPQASVLARLSTFLRPPPIRNMVAQKENKLDVANIMDSGKILLARFPQGLIGEENTYLLGALLVSKFNQVAMARQDVDESRRRPFFLYIDEFHHFITPSMINILSGARKYHLSLTLAHQQLGQLNARDKQATEAVISNPYTRICFRLGDQDAKSLSQGFSHFNQDDLQSLGVGEAICRFGQSDKDFNLRTYPPPQPNREQFSKKLEIIKGNSRRLYATERHVIESQLNDAFSINDKKPTKKAAVAKPEVVQKEIQESNDTEVDNDREEVAKESDVSVDSYTPTKLATIEKSARPGIGGDRHQNTQQYIEEFARGLNYLTIVEKEILNGKGKVDVSCEKGEVRIAFEISETTTARHEVGNIEKCLNAGYSHIVSVCDDPKKLAEIEEQTRKKIHNTALSQIFFIQRSGIPSFIQKIEAKLAENTQVIAGMKVKTCFDSVSDEEARRINDALIQSVANATKRLKRKKK